MLVSENSVHAQRAFPGQIRTLEKVLAKYAKCVSAANIMSSFIHLSKLSFSVWIRDYNETLTPCFPPHLFCTTPMRNHSEPQVTDCGTSYRRQLQRQRRSKCRTMTLLITHAREGVQRPVRLPNVSKSPKTSSYSDIPETDSLISAPCCCKFN